MPRTRRIAYRPSSVSHGGIGLAVEDHDTENVQSGHRDRYVHRDRVDRVAGTEQLHEMAGVRQADAPGLGELASRTDPGHERANLTGEFCLPGGVLQHETNPRGSGGTTTRSEPKPFSSAVGWVRAWPKRSGVRPASTPAPDRPGGTCWLNDERAGQTLFISRLGSVTPSIFPFPDRTSRFLCHVVYESRPYRGGTGGTRRYAASASRLGPAGGRHSSPSDAARRFP